MIDQLGYPKPSLHAQGIGPRQAIGQAADDTVIFCIQLDLAGNATQDAGGADRMIGLVIPLTRFFGQCARRTHLHTRPAKPAPGLDERFIFRDGDPGFTPLFRELENPCPAQLVACPHASPATDAPGKVMHEKGIFGVDGVRPDASFHTQHLGHAQVLLHGLQLQYKLSDQSPCY